MLEQKAKFQSNSEILESVLGPQLVLLYVKGPAEGLGLPSFADDATVARASKNIEIHG